jgi:hypothetical protein
MIPAVRKSDRMRAAEGAGLASMMIALYEMLFLAVEFQLISFCGRDLLVLLGNRDHVEGQESLP